MFLPLLAMILVQLNFSVLPVLQKIILTTLTPWTLLAIRTMGGSLLFMLAYLIWKGRRPLPPAEKVVPWPAFLALSLLGITGNQFLLIIALTMTSSIAAVIIVPSITLFTYLFALLLKRETFSWTRAIALFLGGTGVIVLFADGLVDLLQNVDRSSFYGNCLCLSSAAVYALYLVLSRDWTGKLPALQFTSRLFSYAALWTLVILAIVIGSGVGAIDHFWVRETPRLLQGLNEIPSTTSLSLALLFIVIGPTVVNYFLNFWVLRHMPASAVSGFISLQTLFGAIFSRLVLHEELKPSYGIAAGFILASIGMLSWQLKSERSTAKSAAA